MYGNNSGGGCFVYIAIIALIVLLRACVSVAPEVLNEYGKALNGPYGGLWGLPILFLIIIAAMYFFNRH